MKKPCKTGKALRTSILESHYIFYRKSLIYFRGGDNHSVRKEFHDIESAKESKDSQSKISLSSIAKSGEFWKPFSCIGVICILFRLSCFSILSHYTAPFLDKAGISLDPLIAAILIGLIRLILSLAAFPFIACVSKRTAFTLASGASTIGMFLGKSAISYH